MTDDGESLTDLTGEALLRVLDQADDARAEVVLLRSIIDRATRALKAALPIRDHSGVAILAIAAATALKILDEADTESPGATDG